MTICIAALCENGKTVITASDRMITAPYLALEFEHQNPKLEKVSDTCLALTAGSAVLPDELFELIRNEVANEKNPPVKKVVNSTKKAVMGLRNERAEEAILKPRGLTIAEFYQSGVMEKIDPRIAATLDSQIEDLKLGVEMIVTGIDGAGGHIWFVEDKHANCFDSIGFTTIGSVAPKVGSALSRNYES